MPMTDGEMNEPRTAESTPAAARVQSMADTRQLNDAQRLQQLLTAQHACVSIATVEEEEAMRALRQMAVEVGIDAWLWTNSIGLRDALLSNAPPIADTTDPAAALYKLSTTMVRPAVLAMVDLAAHLKNERVLRQLRDLILICGHKGSMTVLIDAQSDLPPAIRSVATPFDLSLPDEAELEQVVKSVLRTRLEAGAIRVDIDRRSFQTILRNLRGLSARQARQVILDTISRDHAFDISQVNKVLAEKRKQFQAAGLLEYVESPVDLNEIGGLNKLKGWLKQRQCALSDEAAAFGIPPPRGVLMLGMQGAGKSLSAKAVATSWQRPLLRLNVGALYDRYIGESERRLSDALRQAEMMSPIILWIDEIEKAFASAASQSTDGGLSMRMFGSLLTWMQEHRSAVFLIATANDIEALPPELLRKGRFDEIFFVDLPDLEARRHILSIHLSKRKREPEQFDLDTLAEAAGGFSGAEIEQAVIAALCQAFSAGQELSNEHLIGAIKNSPPLSVTMAERVEALRQWAAGRCVPAD
jgi:ATPase family associated with various cellular activities (AAA)